MPADSLYEWHTTTRDQLAKDGVVVEKDGLLRTAQDYTFSSPSMAAAVILGRSVNGRTAWKDDAGPTLKEIQEAQLLLPGG